MTELPPPPPAAAAPPAGALAAPGARPGVRGLPRADAPRPGRGLRARLGARSAVGLSLAVHGALGLGLLLRLAPDAPGAGSAPRAGEARAELFVRPPEAGPAETFPDEPEPPELPAPPILEEAPPIETARAPEPLPEIEIGPLPEEVPSLPALEAPDLAAARRLLKPPAPTVPPETTRPPEPAPALTPARPAAPRATPAPPGGPSPAALTALERPKPPLPAGYALAGERTLLLTFYVAADGAVRGVAVLRSSGDARLDDHVREFVARRWRFAPTAAPRWVAQPVTYRLAAG